MSNKNAVIPIKPLLIMGTMQCILTGRDVNYKHLDNHYYYTLNIADNEVQIFICISCKNKIKFEGSSGIVEGLIANKKWPDRIEIVAESCNLSKNIANGETVVLHEFLRSADYPKTPKGKLEHLFLNLFKMQTFDGESFRIEVQKNEFLVKNYFSNLAESVFYLEGLEEQGLINYQKNINDGSVATIGITHLGLSKSIELTEEGDKSMKCFVAMSFDPSMKDSREAIRKAITETGYEAVIMDEQIIESERTVNDEIIASLKKCKFCIADFSLHSKGVYFESGFALGQGKKVIYTCSKSEFENAHFDIKPLQHIIYDSTDQLTEELINKIEAFIK